MTTVSAGPLESLPEDRGLAIDVGGDRVAVFKVGNGAHAIADRCSHAEASLAEGELFDGEVECPRHGAGFDVATGEPLSLPATKPVRTFTTEVRDGEVMITIDEESS